MVDRALGEAAAHGEAGVPGPDDECSRSQFMPSLLTDTETFVGLVMTS